jgi:tetratricopeptide (TPR) repeat protein
MQSPNVSELEVLGLIGTGACGRVYRARNAGGAHVAVKIFAEAAVNRDLLEESALRLEDASWPAGVLPELAEDYRGKQILRVTSFLADEVEGAWVPRSLQHRLERFPGEQSWPLVLEILKALTAMHERQVAHGNLKPGNVFFDDENRALLTDWALGNMPGVTALEYTDAVLYQPPDQLREPEGFLREKGYRWDVFSFAVLAFRLVTGAFPRCTATFDQVAPEPGKSRREGIAANLKQIAKAVAAQPEVTWPDAAANPLEQSYREILDRCLALDHAARPANAGEVLRLFQAAEQALAEERQRDAILDQQRRARRSAWRANVAAGVLAGAVVVVSVLWKLKTAELVSEETGRKADVARLESAYAKAEAQKVATVEKAEEERRTLQYDKDLWLARIEASRATGDHLFAWAMEKGHRNLPPLDGRDLRLKRLEHYFQDFITRNAEVPALKEERARARLQLAEVSLAKGDPKAAAQRLEEALASAADLPAGPDLDLRLATDRLLLGLLLQEQNDPSAAAAYVTARKALEAVPQAEVDVDRVQQLLAVLDYHESRMLAAAGNDEAALNQLLRATVVLNRLVAQRPDAGVLRSELVSCFLSSATILDGIGQMGDAREVRALAADKLLEMLRNEPGNLELRLNLAGCYGGMAEAAIFSGDVASAESNSKAAVKLLEELLVKQPDNPDVRSTLAAQRGLVAGILRDRGNHEEAMKLLDEGILLVEQIAVGESADPVAKYRLAILLWQKGRMIGADGKRDEEIVLETRAADMLRKLENSDYGLVRAEQIRLSMGYVLGDLGHAAQLAKNLELARAAFGEAVAVFSQLKRERPQNEEYDEGLVWSQKRLKEL